MIMNSFSSSNPGSLCKWAHRQTTVLSLGISVHITSSTFYPYNRRSQSDVPSLSTSSEAGFCRFALRHELWFRCHNHCVLKQIAAVHPAYASLACSSSISGSTSTSMNLLINVDFPCPDRSHNTNVDFSIRPRFDIFVYLKSIHQNTPMHELVLLLTGYAENIPSMYRILLTMYKFSTYGCKKNINLHMLCI